jgi:hypothetical protein
MAIRIVLGLFFLIGGFLALIITWSPYMTPVNPPPMFGSPESFELLATNTIEGIVMAIGLWLFVSGRNAQPSSS